MKKLICSILILLMLPSSLLFVGCKDKKNIKDFYKTYLAIADSTSHLTLVETTDTYDASSNSWKLDIDYASAPELSSLVEVENSAYHHLKYFYQELLDNTLSPLYFFGESISSSKKVTQKQTDKLFKDLDNLEECYKDIDYYLGILKTSLKTSQDESVNLFYLNKLYVQYEQAIISASNLSAVVNEVYFNTILTRSSYDYSSKPYTELTNADLNSITINTRARMYYYKSIYANVYIQRYLRNSNLAETLANSSATVPTFRPYTEICKIDSLNSKNVETLASNKKEIHNAVIMFNNITNNLMTAYKHFNIATSKIAYLDVNVNTSSREDINYANFISQFANGIVEDSYEILNNLTILLYA